MEVQQVRGVSLVDAAYAALRAEILAARIPPGEPLTEQGLATRFDIARPTAKAAVERLVTEGLLVRTMHRSAHVPVLNAADIQDVFALRELLERVAVVALASGKSVPTDAERALAEMEAADATGDVARLVEADVAFHRALVSASGSLRRDRAHQQVMGEAQLAIIQDQVLLLEQAVGVAAEHRAILTAIAGGDAEAAERLVAEHLGSVSRRVSNGAATD
ncbi:GntR family transcriptional regulator [Beutenbergia cavernae]|nr:GntR family transcriptional regulator [Beutenbergia cavernae]